VRGAWWSAALPPGAVRALCTPPAEAAAVAAHAAAVEWGADAAMGGVGGVLHLTRAPDHDLR
jgi:hypothetical protein